MLSDADAERAVLGYALRNPRLAQRQLMRIQRAWFYTESHRIIWDAIAQHSEPTIANVLLTLGAAQSTAGGSAYLCELSERAPTWAAARRACARIRDVAVLSRLVAVGRELTALGTAAEVDIADASARAVDAIMRAGDDDAASWHDLRHLAGVTQRLQMEAEEARAEGGATYYSTGIDVFDSIDSRSLPRLVWAPGRQYVIAGRPGSGKSSLLRQIVRGQVQRQPKLRAALLTLEMPEEDQAAAFWATASGVPADQITAPLTPAQRAALTDAFSADDLDRIFVRRPRRYDWPTIRQEIEFAIRCLGCELIAVDYVGLIDTDSQRRRAEALGEVSKGGKRLATTHNVQIILAAQLNRDIERRAGLPTLSDLRESGDLEQDADAVVFCHQERDEGGHTRDAERAIVCAKNRKGSTWTDRVEFDGPRTAFGHTLTSRDPWTESH